MLDIKITTRIIKRNCTYFEINGKEYKFSDLYTIADGLCCSSMVEPIVIYNDSIKKLFEKLEVCNTMSRGSSYRGKNHEKFFDFLNEVKNDGYAQLDI